jgi:hypothetical protein
MSNVIVEQWSIARIRQVNATDGEEYKIEIRQNAVSNRFDARCWRLEDGAWKLADDFPWVDAGNEEDAWKIAAVKLGDIV